jgi:6-phosphogluconolactonase/glucosamine-6-phosphate isomerase/deaminase
MHGVQWGQVHVVNLDEYSKSSQGYQKTMIPKFASR